MVPAPHAHPREAWQAPVLSKTKPIPGPLQHPTLVLNLAGEHYLHKYKLNGCQKKHLTDKMLLISQPEFTCYRGVLWEGNHTDFKDPFIIGKIYTKHNMVHYFLWTTLYARKVFNLIKWVPAALK